MILNYKLVTNSPKPCQTDFKLPQLSADAGQIPGDKFAFLAHYQ